MIGVAPIVSTVRLSVAPLERATNDVDVRSLRWIVGLSVNPTTHDDVKNARVPFLSSSGVFHATFNLQRTKRSRVCTLKHTREVLQEDYQP